MNIRNIIKNVAKVFESPIAAPVMVMFLIARIVMVLAAGSSPWIIVLGTLCTIGLGWFFCKLYYAPYIILGEKQITEEIASCPKLKK